MTNVLKTALDEMAEQTRSTTTKASRDELSFIVPKRLVLGVPEER